MKDPEIQEMRKLFKELMEKNISYETFRAKMKELRSKQGKLFNTKQEEVQRERNQD